MTKREQLIECAEAMENGMLNIQYKRDIWQNELIYWICKAIKLLIEVQLKNLKDQVKEMGQMGKTIYESGIQKKLWRRKEQ